MSRQTLVFALLTCGGAFAQRLEFEGRYWIVDSTLKARVKAPALATDVDFKKDLGITDNGAPDLRFTYYTQGRSFVRFGYMRDAWDADSTAQRTVEFNNRIYQVGTRIVTHFDLQQIRLSYANQFIRAARDRFRFGVMVEGYGLGYDASLTAPQLNVRAEDKRWVGFPTAGLVMNVRPVEKVELFAEGTGMSLGKYGYTTNFEAGGRLIPVKRVSVVAGYRFNRTNPKLQADRATMTLAGPFVGASVRF